MRIAARNKRTNLSQNGNGHASFIELLEEYDYPDPRRGQILQGELLRIEEDALFIDVGAKRDAIVPYKELNRLDDTLLNGLSQGDHVPVYVQRTPIGDDFLLVSLEKGLEKEDWERVEQHMANDDTLDLEVVGHNKGGVIVKFRLLHGFVPNSHVPQLQHVHDHNERVSIKSMYVGQTMALKVVEVDQERRRLVLSATAAQKEHRQKLLRDLDEGQVVQGRVDHIATYGAFIDLGVVSGLLHISEMAWEHVEHPSELLSVGDEVEAVVDEVDVERERISLSRKQLLPSPWQQAMDTLSEGDLIEGEITAVRNFGAFVKLPVGIEGLIHASEMPPSGTAAPNAVLQPGDPVLVRIVSIQPDRERLGLSMRRVSAAEEIEWMAARQKEEKNQ